MAVLWYILIPLFAQAPDGSTDLHWATYRDDVDAASALLRRGVDVNAATDLGVTPLWAAAQNGNVVMVRKLLQSGADPNRALRSGETPLMVAARSGHADVISLLLAKGADPNARGTRRQTALMWAASQKHAPVVQTLLAHGVDIHARSDVWTQRMAVPPHGHPAYNRDIPHGGSTALLFAARSGDLASAQLLVAAGANVNDKDAWGVSATVLAAHSDFRELAGFLLEKGADPNAAAAGFTALHAAIMHRDEKLVEALLRHGADANAPLRTWTPTRRSSRDFHFAPALVGARPFWLAARFGTAAMLRLLVKHGADPRFVHRSEYLTGNFVKHVEVTTALHAALGMGGGTAWVLPPREQREAMLLDVVRVAIECGVAVNAKNTDGRTALDAAKALRYETVAKALASAAE